MAAVQAPIIPIIGELVRSHPGTISLGQGVVWYGPPQAALDRASSFAGDPDNHKYQPVEGIAPLVEGLESKLTEENRLPLDSSRVVVTAGGNMAFMNAILAITDPGDEIILESPYYFNHEMAVTMASCRPVLCNTDSSYQLEPDAIAQAITERTRAVVTISPNNPSGSVYSRTALSEVNCLCRERGIYHISDEAYENFVYDGAEHFSPGSLPGAQNYTISLYSMSKAYGFASWRVGYMVVPEHLFVAVKKIQDTILICPPVVSQHAALGALSAGSAYCRERIGVIAEVRTMVLDELQPIRQFCRVPRTSGAFYLLLELDTRIGPLELAERLIREHGVAVIPGTAFGITDRCVVRVSYGALSREAAKEGIRRLVKGLRALID
jgi:aspartate/methionine/tyrosine aminotransferase